MKDAQRLGGIAHAMKRQSLGVRLGVKTGTARLDHAIHFEKRGPLLVQLTRSVPFIKR